VQTTVPSKLLKTTNNGQKYLPESIIKKFYCYFHMTSLLSRCVKSTVKKVDNYVKFHILTAVSMKMRAFWDIVLYPRRLIFKWTTVKMVGDRAWATLFMAHN
jgi:hypothetical protein